MAGFKEFHDLDSSTTFCPCGRSFERSDARNDDAAFAAWKEEHAAHVDTDATQHAITDDGMRACADDTNRTWVDGQDGAIRIVAGNAKPGGSLAVTPCQMMLGHGPGSPDERPCGTQPTVGGNRLYRYCAAHLDLVAKAGGTVYRDADADATTVTLSVTGTKSGIFAAPQPDQERKVIRCENAWAATPAARIVEVVPGPAWTPGTVFAVGNVVSTPTGKFQCTASGMADGPAPVFGVLTTLPTEVLYPETAPYLKTLRDRTAPDKERLDARRWLRNNGYAQIADVRAECEQASDEIQMARLERADALPVGKAPQCGHQALTDGCSTCAILREHLARVGVERAARILMAEAGALGPADADDLRREFELPTALRPVDGGGLLPDCLKGVSGGRLAMVTVSGPRPMPPDDTTFNAWPPAGSVQPNPERETWPSDASVAGLRERMAPPPRPDGFSQSAVDAAKAVLLAPVAPKGGKR